MFNLNLSRWLRVTAHIYGRLLLPARCDLHQVRLPSYPLSLVFSLSFFSPLSLLPSTFISVPCSHPPTSLHSRMASSWGSVVILSRQSHPLTPLGISGRRQRPRVAPIFPSCCQGPHAIDQPYRLCCPGNHQTVTPHLSGHVPFRAAFPFHSDYAFLLIFYEAELPHTDSPQLQEKEMESSPRSSSL